MSAYKPSEFSDLTCPFCGESGFDGIGLKMHLVNGWCEDFEATPSGDPPANEPRESASVGEANTTTKELTDG